MTFLTNEVPGPLPWGPQKPPNFVGQENTTLGVRDKICDDFMKDKR